MYSICSNVPPVHFQIIGPTLRAVQLREDQCVQSPLRFLNSGKYKGMISELPACTKILKDAFDVFEMLCIDTCDAETAADAAHLFHIRREEAWGRLQLSLEDGKREQKRMTEAIIIAAAIHFRAVVFRIQHSDNINVDDMRRLHAIIKATDYQYWKNAGYVYLWM